MYCITDYFTPVLLWLRIQGLHLEFPTHLSIRPSPKSRLLTNFNLLVNIKGRQVVHADCPKSVIFRASDGLQPAFLSVAFLSAPQQVKKLLEDYP